MPTGYVCENCRHAQAPCNNCRQPADWHEHDYDEWYCDRCAQGYGSEWDDEGDPHAVVPDRVAR